MSMISYLNFDQFVYIKENFLGFLKFNLLRIPNRQFKFKFGPYFGEILQINSMA